jgi:hypothetical protein
MDPLENIGFVAPQNSGQTICPKCLKTYNNRAVPEFCECDKYLGGRFVAKEKKSKDSQLITSTLASVRTNTAGIPTRTFVDVSVNKVRYTTMRYGINLYLSPLSYLSYLSYLERVSD